MKCKPLIFSAIIGVFSVTASAESIPPHDKIPFTSAQKVAMNACKGKVMSSGLEQRAGTWFYTFEIKNRKKKFEVLVNALSGKLEITEELSSH